MTDEWWKMLHRDKTQRDRGRRLLKGIRRGDINQKMVPRYQQAASVSCPRLAACVEHSLG